MKYLSLFSGVGGGDLAFQHLLEGFRCIGYVENGKYPQDVIRQRIEDGLLDCAPIFGDIREFNREYAEGYQNMADLITGGFPCQPFSVAGKQKGEQDERNMWPEFRNTIRIIRPQYAFLENVPGLLASGYMPQIFSDLAEVGYDARWFVLGADDVGANHRRKRLWILAIAINSINRGRVRSDKKTNSLQKINRSPICSGVSCGTGEVANANNPRNRTSRNGINSNGEKVNKKQTEQSFGGTGRYSQNVSDTTKPRLERQESEGELSGREPGLFAECSWWTTEPAVG